MDRIRRAGCTLLCGLGMLALCIAPARLLAGEEGSEAFDLQGHRGARGLHPENTLEGFREALAIGVDTLELDLGVTRDGTLVVHHDERLSPDIVRGPDGRWLDPPTPRLRVLTWKQIGAYDVGRLRPDSEYAARFPDQQPRDGTRIPRFVDVIELAERISGGTIRYNVETKLNPLDPASTIAPAPFAAAVIAALQAAGVESRTLVQSFDWRTLQHLLASGVDIATACLTDVRAKGGTIRRGESGPSPWTAGFDVDDFDGSVPRLVHAAGCRVWSPDYQDLSLPDVQRAHGLGLRVIPWTVNRSRNITALLDLGVDGMISDHPERVRAVLAERGLPLPQAFEEP